MQRRKILISAVILLAFLMFLIGTRMFNHLVFDEQKKEKSEVWGADKEIKDYLSKIEAFIFGKKESEDIELEGAYNTLEDYLNEIEQIEPDAFTLRQVDYQVKTKFTFQQYLQLFTTQSRMTAGYKVYRENALLLKKIQETYHVTPAIIVALWGIETNYGTNVGRSHLIRTLTTLSNQSYRKAFYRRELKAALQMLNTPPVIHEQEISTWDGGMGHPSFEPTTYFDLAVDFDRSGFKNIWTSVPDALASIANFLHRRGWKEDQPWSMEVDIKSARKIPVILINNRKRKYPIDFWQKMGVKTLNGQKWPKRSLKAAILLPDKEHTYLVFNNFDVLMRWNAIPFEALAVGIIADKLAM